MKQKRWLNNALFISIALTLMIFSVMLYVSYRQKKQEDSAAALISQSQETIYQTTKLLSFVTDNETGSRGYALTGNKAFLEPLIGSRENIRKQVDVLRKLTINNTAAEKLIDSLLYYAEKRMSFSDSTINLRDKSGLNGVAEMVATGRGKLYIDSVRRKVNQLITNENGLLAERLKTHNQQAEQNEVKFLSAAFIVVVLLLLLIWSELKRIEERLYSRSKNEMELLYLQINNANDAIYTLDDKQRIKSWNSGAEKLYGFTRQEALEINSTLLLRTVITDAEMSKALKELEENMYWSGELERKTKAGETVYVSASISCVKNSAGKITGYVSVNKDIGPQRKLNQQLNHLAAIVEQSPEAIFSRGTDQRIISWNNGAEQLFGYAKAEAIGTTITALGILKLDAEEIKRVEKEIVETGRWNSEKNFINKKGETIYGAVTANCMRNEEGEIISFNFFVKNITRRKQLEDELRKINEDLEEKVQERTKAVIDKERNYRYLFENNPLPMWVIDTATFEFLDVNATALVHYGYSREEFLSMTAADIRPAEDKQAFVDINRNEDVKQQNKNLGVWRHIKKDGSIIKVEINSHPIQFENKPAALVLVNDVTEKVKAEEKLTLSEQRFRALVENNYDIISLVDASWNIMYRSPSATRVSGWTDEEAKSRKTASVIHPDDLEKEINVLKEVQANPGKPVKTLFRSRHKLGHYLWMEGVITNYLTDEFIQAIVVNLRDVTERVEAEEKLKASEEQFRYSLDNMLEGVQIVSFDWKYIYVNKALCKQGKYEKEELLGYTMMEKYPGIENTVLFKSCQRCMKERISIHLENEFEFPDNTKGSFELSIQPVPEGVFILSVDISDRKRAEEELKHNEKRFRSLIENISDAIVLNDADSNILYQSPSVTTILGYGSEERKGKKALDYVHPDSREAFTNLYKILAQLHGVPLPFQYQIRHKNGHYVWLEGVVTNLVNEPEVNGYVANYRDITQRKELEERLNKAYTLARIGTWEIDMVNGTVFWSDITKEIHETAHDFLPDLETGINFYKEGATRELIANKVKEAIEFGKPWDVELQIITAKNNERWIRSIGETEFSGGKCIRVYGSFQDIDKLKKTEEKIRQLNLELEEKILVRTAQLRKSNEELEAFSYSVSHDLRAPLRAIIGYTTILQEDHGSTFNEEAQRVTEIIKHNTQRMGVLIDDLLAFSRIGKQELAKISVNTTKLVEEVIKSITENESRHSHINWVIHPLPPVDADCSSLRQVWTNLINNAVKYSSKKSAPLIEIGAYQQNDKIVFYVKDNGVGFNEKYKGKLFKVFQRLHSINEFEGTGIGLAIVDKIISKHGGEVWAEGAVDKGASVYFSMPLLTEIH